MARPVLLALLFYRRSAAVVCISWLVGALVDGIAARDVGGDLCERREPRGLETRIDRAFHLAPEVLGGDRGYLGSVDHGLVAVEAPDATEPFADPRLIRPGRNRHWFEVETRLFAMRDPRAEKAAML